VRPLSWAIIRLLGCVPILMSCLAGAAAAQLVRGRPSTIELRPIGSLAVGHFGTGSPGFGAGTGVGAAVAVHVPVTRRFAVYGGYDYERFGCGDCATAGFDDHLAEAGFEAGLEAALPGRIDPWVSAGLLIHRRLEIPEGGGGFSSESSTGWSAAMGVLVPITSGVRLRPGIRYRAYSAKFILPDLGFALLGETGAFERRVDVTSIALEVGFSVDLPHGS